MKERCAAEWRDLDEFINVDLYGPTFILRYMSVSVRTYNMLRRKKENQTHVSL
jgi:hypothetical protein